MATTTGSPFPTSDQPPRSSMGGTDDLSRTSGAGAYGSSSDDTLSRPYGSTEDTMGRVKQGAHDAVDRLAEKAGPAVEKLRSSVNDMSDTVRAKAGQFSEMEEEWMESCRATVREHPIASVAVAVAAGVILSKMMSSR